MSVFRNGPTGYNRIAFCMWNEEYGTGRPSEVHLPYSWLYFGQIKIAADIKEME